MKRINLLWLLCGSVAFAQSPVKTEMLKADRPALKSSARLNPQHLNRLRMNDNNSRSYYPGFWIDYADARELTNGGTDFFSGGPSIGNLNINYLFPDSTVLATFGTSLGNVWIHNLGHVLDPFATVYRDIFGANYSSSQAYVVDSFMMVYLYDRLHPDTTIVDTLIVDFYTSQDSSNLWSYYFATHPCWPNDTVRVNGQLYYWPTNEPWANNVTQFKIPLTIADTANSFFGLKAFETNMAVPAGTLTAISVRFQPGYTYNFGDTIDANKNYFTFATVEELGQNTCPTYTPNDWNVSSIVPTDVRYNISGGWDSLFIPTYAYYQSYGLEHHYFVFYVSQACANVVPAFSQSVNVATKTVTFTNTTTNATSYLWNFGDSQTSTAVNPSHTYATLGTYNVTLTASFDADTCSRTLSKSVTVNTGIDELENVFNLGVYPTPSSGSLFIDMNNFAGKSLALEVYDMKGRRIYSEEISRSGGNVKHIDLSAYANGMYMLKATDADGRTAKGNVLLAK